MNFKWILGACNAGSIVNTIIEMESAVNSHINIIFLRDSNIKKSSVPPEVHV